MKSITKKIVATVSSVALVLTLTGTISALSQQSSNNTVDVSSTESESSSDSNELYKDETVYVIAGADGSVKKIIVSDWIKNALSQTSINDKTELSDVENVKGDETYSMNPDNMKVWDAQGNDIYYQGTIEKALPVDISIKYELDGKTVTPDDLAGKSGKLKMTFDYKNNQKQSVEIDGKTEDIYVPFVMLTGMIVDNSVFTNIEVSNGKVLSDGNRSVIAGFALPGMQESLGISKDTFEIPESFEITADVTDFSLTTTLTLATNDIFNNLDLNGVDSLDKLKGAMDDLQSASNQLVDGSSALYNGLATLLSKSGDLIAGIDKLYDGSAKLSAGADQLSAGASELQSGMEQLYGGLGTLSSKSSELVGGAKQVFDTLLSTADTQIAAAGIEAPALTVENYSAVLDGLVANLSDENIAALANQTAREEVTAQVKQNESTVREQIEAGYKDQIISGVLAASGLSMSADQYKAAVAAGQIPAETQEKINAAVSSKIDELVDQKINELIDENMNSDKVKAQIEEGIASAKKGRESLKALKGQLDSYNTFYTGINEYTGGVDSAKDGAAKLNSGAGSLKSGAGQLSSGAAELKNGISSLKDGGSTLIDGVSQLKDGALTLSDGMKKFNEEGINALVNAFDGDLSSAITRLRAISDVSKTYNSFAGISDEMSGSVKFVYRTESISND